MRDEIRDELRSAKEITARLLEKLIDETRDQTDTVSGAVVTSGDKQASAIDRAAHMTDLR